MKRFKYYYLVAIMFLASVLGNVLFSQTAKAAWTAEDISGWPYVINPRAVALHGTDVYVADLSKSVIRKMNIGGDGGFGVDIGPAMPFGPAGIAVDDNKIYFTNVSTSTLYAMDFEGGNLTTIYDENLIVPIGLAVDSGYIYVAESGLGQIVRIDKVGSTITPFMMGISDPYDVAVDNNYIYVAQYNNHQIIKADKNGTIVSMMALGSAAPMGIDVDSNGYIYYTDYNGASVMRMKNDGSNKVEIFSIEHPQGVAVGSDGCIYVTSTGADGAVPRVTKLQYIDTEAPTITSVAVPPSGSYKAGNTLDFTVNFNEPVTVTGTDTTLDLVVGGTVQSAVYQSKTSNSITYRHTVQAGDSDSNGITLTGITLGATTVKDAAENDAVLTLNSVGSTAGVLVDTTAPVVSSVTVPSSGTYKVGDALHFAVVFDESVTVTGSDSVLGITVGSTARTATYLAKTGNTITYRYVVQAGDIDNDGITVGAISLNTTTIQDAAANNAVLTLNSVGATGGVLIDGVVPYVVNLSTPAFISYKIGNTLNFTVGFNEDVTIIGTDSTLQLVIGGATRNAVYQSKDSNSITYRYTIQAGDNDSDGIALGNITFNTTTVRDTANNNANPTISFAGVMPGLCVDTTVPTVTSVAVPSAGSYKAGRLLDFTVTFSEAVAVTGTNSSLGITVGSTGATATYLSKTADSITYRYTVQAGDTDSNGITVGAININTTTIQDEATNNAVLTLNSVGDTSGVLVDTTAPEVTSVTVPTFGSYKVGDALYFTINFDDIVIVTGMDSILGLTVGSSSRTAPVYAITSNSIKYRYTVQAGDSDNDGITVGAITLNTTMVQDAATNNAVLILNSVGSTAGVLVDGVVPYLTSLSTPPSGSYIAGDTLSFTVDFSETVNIIGTDSTLGIVMGGTVRNAVYQSKTSNSITYSYTIQAGDNDSDGIAIDSITLNTTMVKDTANNNANMTLNAGWVIPVMLVDTTAPVVTTVTVPSTSSYKTGVTLDITVDFGEAVTVTGTDSTLGLTVGSTARTATYLSKTASSITYRYIVQSGDTDSNGIAIGTINLYTTTIRDAATNNAVLTLNSVGDTSGVLVDTTVPEVNSVTVPSSGSYKVGDTLDFTVNFSEAVTVTGTDFVLGLTIGGTARTATYLSKTSNSITCRYTVQAGDIDSDGITIGAINLNTTTVQDAASNSAVMILNSVGDTSGVLIDAVVPIITSVTVPAPSSYKVGNTLDFTVNFSEAVTVTGTDSVIGLTLGSTARTAAYLSKTSSSITYRYTVQLGDTDGDGITIGVITLNTTTIQDATTNDAVLTLNSVGATSAVLVDTTVPIVSSVAVPSFGNYKAGNTLEFTVNYNEAVTVTGTDSVLILTIGSTTRSAAYLSKAANSITYRYTVQAGDTDSDGITINTIIYNTTTVQDTATNDVFLAMNGVGATSGVLIDTTVPTVSSVVVPSSGNNKAGATLDFTVNFNEAVTVTGVDSVLGITVGGTTRSAAYQTKTTNSITYRYTVQVGDIDNDGITVGTISLNTTTVQDAATNNAVLTLNSVGATSGVLVDATAPIVTSVAVPSSGSYRADDTLDFTVNFSEAVTVTGSDSVLGLTLGSTARSAVYQSKTANSITYRYTVQPGDADSNGISIAAINLNTTTVQDTALNDAILTLNSVGATAGVLIDTTEPTVTSVTVPSTGNYKAGDTLDFTVNFSEAVTVAGTDSTLGLTVGSTARTATYLSKTANSITYRYIVQPGDTDSDGITIGTINLITTTVQDAFTNNAELSLNSVGATAGVLIDTTAPTVTSVTVPSTGSYKAGDTLDFTVTFSEAITVTGVDFVLGITVGGTTRSAAYQTKTTNSITYRYTVQVGDIDNDGITVGTISLNTTTVQDAAINNAVLTLNSVGATSGVLIDATAPSVTSVAVPSSGSYKADDTLDFTVNISEAVTITGTDSVLGITVGSTVRTAAYLSKTTNSITYRYTVQPGDTDNNGITIGTLNLNMTTVQDAVINNAVLTLNSVGATTGVLIDAAAPVVTSVAVPASGSYKTGYTLDFTVNFSEEVTVTGTDSVLEIAVGSTARTATYLSKTTNSITYRYVVQAGDTDSDGITIGTINLNTTTVQDAVFNNAILTLNSVGATSGVIIDTTVPATVDNADTITEGELEKEQQREAGAPEARINNSIDTLKAGVLTDLEQAKVAAGVNAKVTLKIEDISSTVSDADKKLLEEKLRVAWQNADQQDSTANVLYVDISLFKQIGYGEATRVTETRNMISISIEVPEAMWSNNEGFSRTYHIARVHDNEVELLDGIYDPVTHLFTFETDRFSTYALTYQDKITVFKDFYQLHLTAKAAATSQKLKFAKMSGADGYLIYGSECGKDMTLLADVAGMVTSYTVKSLKQATYYKYQVKAYKLVSGEKVILAISKTVHSGTTSKTYGNPDKITSKVSEISLEVGKSELLVCEVVLPEGRKLLKHTSLISYESTNKSVATISSKGKIIAKSKGDCYVYAYAQNGVYQKIKITVE